MIIRCLYDELISVKDLKPNPRNRNNHPDEQIKQLAKILNYQGWRYPVKVSKQSGFITSGHGRVLAAKINGWDKIPVNFQDYDSPDQEYLDLQADNAIALQSELDLDSIRDDLKSLPHIEINLLGIKDLILDPVNEPMPKIEEPPKQFIVATYLKNELEMQDLFDDLTSKGYECKLIT